jgi:hypothetical protein
MQLVDQRRQVLDGVAEHAWQLAHLDLKALALPAFQRAHGLPGRIDGGAIERLEARQQNSLDHHRFIKK